MSSPDPRIALLPCDQCKSLRKLCHKQLPSCERCNKRGVSCTYREGAIPSTPKVSVDPTFLTHAELLELVRDLYKRLADAETALAAANAELNQFRQAELIRETLPKEKKGFLVPSPWTHDESSMAVGEPIQAPTAEEWIIASQLITSMKYSLLCYADMALLENFTVIPSSLRFSLCAQGALAIDPKLAFHYYNLARKAIVRDSQQPNQYSAITYILLSNFLTQNGHPMLAGVHFSKAIATLFACKLNYDPDFVVPTATDTEKENRRHLFWIMYFLAKNVEIAVAKYPFRPIDCSKVKFAKKPNSTKPLWESPSNEIATVCYISGILDLIREATQLWHKVPSNILEITNSPILSTLRTRLQILQTQIPGHLIVSADKYLEFTTIFLGREIVSDALITTIYYYSAVSVMNRPILYLTKYLPSNSPYLVPLGPIIMSTLLESLLAAETVVGLVSWLLHQCRLGLDGEGGIFRESLWRDMTLSSLNMFEAVISLWFALTQTQSFWWNLVSTTASGPNNPNIVQVMDLNRRIRLRTQVLDVLQTLKDLETSLACAVSDRIYYANFQSTNFITPMVSCIVKMVEQIEDVENLVGGIPSPQETEMESVAIEMSVFSLTEADPEIPAPVTREPWVLLGLLGVNVKGLTWKAWYEEEWRQFWLQVARGEK